MTREDLLISCTAFYDSKTRSNRYGNRCDLCYEKLEGKCKRAIQGVNSYGCTNYTTVHEQCFIKSLKTEIPKSKKNNIQQQKDFDKSIQELEALI